MGAKTGRETVWLYLVLSFMWKFGSSFTFAMYVIYLRTNGLNYLEVNLVNLVFYVAMFVFEIPTGAIADVFGRKTSFVISCVMLAVTMFIYGSVHSFAGFIAAEICAAIGFTCASGAFQAWLVDRLRHQGYEGGLNGIFTKANQFDQLAGLCGALTGGMIADHSMKMAWYGGGVVMVVTAITALGTMKEEYFIPIKGSIHEHYAELRSVVGKSIVYISQQKAVRFIILIGFFQYLAVQAPNMQWQPMFLPYVKTKTGLALICAGITLTSLVGSGFSRRFLAFINDEKMALVVAQVLVGMGVVLTVVTMKFPVILSMFLLHEAARGLWKPLKDTYLNDNIPSKERATIISCESIVHHVAGAIGLFLSGVLAQYVSVKVAWIVFGTILIIGSLVVAKNGRK